MFKASTQTAFNTLAPWYGAIDFINLLLSQDAPHPFMMQQAKALSEQIDLLPTTQKPSFSYSIDAKGMQKLIDFAKSFLNPLPFSILPAHPDSQPLPASDHGLKALSMAIVQLMDPNATPVDYASNPTHQAFIDQPSLIDSTDLIFQTPCFWQFSSAYPSSMRKKHTALSGTFINFLESSDFQAPKQLPKQLIEASPQTLFILFHLYQACQYYLQTPAFIQRTQALQTQTSSFEKKQYPQLFAKGLQQLCQSIKQALGFDPAILAPTFTSLATHALPEAVQLSIQDPDRAQPHLTPSTRLQTAQNPAKNLFNNTSTLAPIDFLSMSPSDQAAFFQLPIIQAIKPYLTKDHQSLKNQPSVPLFIAHALYAGKTLQSSNTENPALFPRSFFQNPSTYLEKNPDFASFLAYFYTSTAPNTYSSNQPPQSTDPLTPADTYYLSSNPQQRLVANLLHLDWALATHLFDQFDHTSRQPRSTTPQRQDYHCVLFTKKTPRLEQANILAHCYNFSNEPINLSCHASSRSLTDFLHYLHFDLTHPTVNSHANKQTNKPTPNEGQGPQGAIDQILPLIKTLYAKDPASALNLFDVLLSTYRPMLLTLYFQSDQYTDELNPSSKPPMSAIEHSLDWLTQQPADTATLDPNTLIKFLPQWMQEPVHESTPRTYFFTRLTHLFEQLKSAGSFLANSTECQHLLSKDLFAPLHPTQALDPLMDEFERWIALHQQQRINLMPQHINPIHCMAYLNHIAPTLQLPAEHPAMVAFIDQFEHSFFNKLLNTSYWNNDPKTLTTLYQLLNLTSQYTCQQINQTQQHPTRLHTDQALQHINSQCLLFLIKISLESHKNRFTPSFLTQSAQFIYHAQGVDTKPSAPFDPLGSWEAGSLDRFCIYNADYVASQLPEHFYTWFAKAMACMPLPAKVYDTHQGFIKLVKQPFQNKPPEFIKALIEHEQLQLQLNKQAISKPQHLRL